MPKQYFNLPRWQSISRRVVTGTFTIRDFYAQTAGTLTRISVDQGTRWKVGVLPEFTTTADAEIPGALFHIVYHTPNRFVVRVERISDPSAPGSGDLVVKWTRRGYTH